MNFNTELVGHTISLANESWFAFHMRKRAVVKDL